MWRKRGAQDIKKPFRSNSEGLLGARDGNRNSDTILDRKIALQVFVTLYYSIIEVITAMTANAHYLPIIIKKYHICRQLSAKI